MEDTKEPALPHEGRDIYMICGAAEDARVLMDDIRRHVKHADVVYVPPTSPTPDSDMPGAQIWERSIQEIPYSPDKYTVVLLPDSGNSRRLQQLDDLSQMHPGLRVTAFLENEKLRFEDLYYPHLDTYLVSREQLLTRTFLLEHLPLERLRQQEPSSGALYHPREPFSLGIIGFGVLSQEYLLTTFENTAFETVKGERGLRALILDGNLEVQREAFWGKVPYFADEPALEWLDRDPASPEALEAMEARLSHLHQLLIATPDTQYNMELAGQLIRRFRCSDSETAHPQIVAAQYGNIPGGLGFLTWEPDGDCLRRDSLLSYDALIRRDMDPQAKAMNRQYNTTSSLDTAWNQLGSFRQSANRAIVWDIPNKRLLAGGIDKLSAQEREPYLWELAQYEHLRWNAFQYTHGWTLLPAQELTEEEKSNYRLARASQKRNACLVPWDALDALPQARPGLLKYYDYENVTPVFPTP